MRSLINMVCVYLLLTGRAFRTLAVWDTGLGRGCVWQILTGCVMTEPKLCILLYCSNSKAIVIVHCWMYNFCVLGLTCGLLFWNVFVCQNDCILSVCFYVSQMFQVLYLTSLGWGSAPRNFFERHGCILLGVWFLSVFIGIYSRGNFKELRRQHLRSLPSTSFFKLGLVVQEYAISAFWKAEAGGSQI